MEVHGCGCQHGVDRVAINTPQPIAFQAVFVLQMSDGGLDGGTALHPSPQRFWRPTSGSLIDMHHHIASVVVAAIAHVHMRLPDPDPVPDPVPDLFHLRSQRVAIVGISGKAADADQPSAAAGNRHIYLVAELVRLARLALTTLRTKACPQGPGLAMHSTSGSCTL